MTQVDAAAKVKVLLPNSRPSEIVVAIAITIVVAMMDEILRRILVAPVVSGLILGASSDNHNPRIGNGTGLSEPWKRGLG
ncbi:hypothetical protein B9Z19DRAFT_1120899 [Tuber borchii]|uniref:Uncharacterized protein n=1 Tax=Tuber borchii TaxID=42251 RepID=A0A2T7A3W0_TUBBO|nr:hypothetical protein B9Z19DRAFT_1120899 [Tuber borchii]